MASTRLSDSVFLIGLRDLEPLTRMAQLSAIKQELQRFHQHLKQAKSVRNAGHLTIEEVFVVWLKAAVPTAYERYVVEKLEQFHDEWLLLKKNKGRSSETQRYRELEFTKKFDILINIAHVNAISMIEIDEDRDFLVDQSLYRKIFVTSAYGPGNKSEEVSSTQKRGGRTASTIQESRQLIISSVGI